MALNAHLPGKDVFQIHVLNSQFLCSWRGFRFVEDIRESIVYLYSITLDMNQRLLVLLLIISVLSISCKSRESGKREPTGELSVTYISVGNKSPNHHFKEICDNPELIRLETSDSIVLGQISKIVQAKGNIYILENNLNRVFVFDLRGTYLYSLGLHGRGPKEVLSINDIDIDREAGHLLLLSTESKCVQTYDLDGRYINTVRLGFQCFRFAHMEDGINAFFINYFNEEPYNLRIIGPKKTDIRLFPYPEKIFPMYFYFTGGLKGTNSHTALYSEATSSKIYEVCSDGDFHLKYDIDLGSKQWPESMKYQFTDFMTAISGFKADFLGSKYLELDSLLYFDFMSGNRFRDAYYFFDSGKLLIRGDNLTDDDFSKCMSGPLGLSEKGGLIAIVDPLKLYEANISDQYLLNVYSIERDLLNMVEPGDNPLLFFYGFKGANHAKATSHDYFDN